MGKRLLFLSHDASRTGAPMVLLHLLAWFRDNTEWKLTVLLGEAGPLLSRFEGLAPTFVWDFPVSMHLGRRLIDGARSRLGIPRDPRKGLLRGLAAQSFDAVYANSAASARMIPAVEEHLGAPLLCHVHELEYSLSQYVKTPVFRAAQPFIKHYVAASEATRQNLLQRHGVAPRDVTRVYECIPARRYRSERSRLHFAQARAALGIAADAYVMAGGGSLQWRKGPDLFLQVGRRLAERTDRRSTLLWVGGQTRGEDYARLRYDAERLGLADRLHVTGDVEEPTAHLAASDVFLLTSREDPLALMALEAAVRERPVVCFEGTGGIPELLTGDRGFTVPYADVDAMAEVVARLWAHPELAADTSRRLADYLCAHHDVEVIAPQVRELIREHLLA
jgi:glycosyltransferase involved in cell wall biosynthesis